MEATVVGGAGMDVEEGVAWGAREVGRLDTGMLGLPY